MKQDFPALSGCTYLDTASSGILTQSLFEWRQAHDRDFLLRGSAFRSEQAAFLNGVRARVSRFFHSEERNTFLVPNFSHGFKSLLPLLAPNHRFLLLKGDYPSLVNPFSTAGLQAEELEVGSHFESRLYEAIRRYKPTVFAFSVVQYISGFKLGMELIRAMKKDFPDLLLLADGTQYCGTEPIDFQNSGLDLLGASGYKWMLAGYGNGFMLLSDHLRSAISARQPGLAFEPGHLDTLNFGSMQKAIEYLEGVGMDHIGDRVKWLSGAAYEALKDMRLLHATASDPAFRSQIFNLQISGAMHRRLLAENIVCIERGEGTRVGFHFFNDGSDLEHLVAVLQS
jgi:selenocysteine lyase/cysteine desulfurase